MKLTYKRLLTFLILIASAYMAFAQTLFYVDRISKEDFAKALNSKFVFVYDIWRDIVVENAITDRIIFDARQRFEKLDSLTRLENYDIGLEGEEYEAMFSRKSLILVERYGMYWFMLPSLHDCELYRYDLSGEYLGEMLLPFAISPTGVMVAQKGFDCDGFLDLHFYKRGDSYLREFQTFKNRNLSVSDINNYYTALEYDLPSTSFWLDDSLLYISFLASDGKMVYYWIDNNALDLARIDYSDLYETYMTPIEGQLFEDCTQIFIEGKLRLEPTFLKTYSYWGDYTYDAPVNGILGNDFKRIEVYFYPDVVKTDSVTYSVRGRSKVKKNVCDFSGEVKIKKIYHVFERDADSPDYYKIIADYSLKEDSTQNGSGLFHGILGAYGYVTDDAPEIIKVDNTDQDGDGYMNRSYVGTWQSYKNPATVKRCMWGDNRLPFRFDFDIGAGEIRINPKYASPEWDRFMQWKDLDIVEPESGDSRATYKNPWW